MRWIRDRALTLALMALFVVSLAGQLIAGFHEYNATQQEHRQASVGAADYFASGHPWAALFENWESEFLQMAVFVLLTTILVQKGSPESRRPGVRKSSMPTRATLPTLQTLPGRSDAAGGCFASTKIRWASHS